METEFRIRRAQLDDAETLAQFNETMAEETENKSLDGEVVRNGVRWLLEHPEHGFYLIADGEDGPMGSLMITLEWSDWRNAFFWWIQSVFVRPEARRHGVFTALYQAVEQRALASGEVCGLRLYVDESNTGAQKTYEALGMVPSHYVFYEAALTERST